MNLCSLRSVCILCVLCSKFLSSFSIPPAPDATASLLSQLPFRQDEETEEERSRTYVYSLDPLLSLILVMSFLMLIHVISLHFGRMLLTPLASRS